MHKIYYKNLFCSTYWHKARTDYRILKTMTTFIAVSHPIVKISFSEWRWEIYKFYGCLQMLTHWHWKSCSLIMCQPFRQWIFDWIWPQILFNRILLLTTRLHPVNALVLNIHRYIYMQICDTPENDSWLYCQFNYTCQQNRLLNNDNVQNTGLRQLSEILLNSSCRTFAGSGPIFTANLWANASYT